MPPRPRRLRPRYSGCGIVGIAWKPDTPQLRRVAAGEDGHAVEPLLTMPDGAVAGRFKSAMAATRRRI